MSNFFTDHLKSQLKQISSPKLKFGNQSPTNKNIQNVQIPNMAPQNIQRVPSGKISYRDGNKSQSPDDENSNRGGIIQRIQMKNLAFIPGKTQSPVEMKNQRGQPTQSYNLTNLNANHSNNPNDQSLIKQTKISPQRISPTGVKMVIPANQIKLVKKDGTSPSPEGRQPSMKQIVVSPNQNQNINPNIIPQNRFSQKSLKPQVKAKPPVCQTSDDETNVNSDNEDKVQNFSMLKHDQSQSNFNRPKLNGNQGLNSQASFQDQQLNQQKTQRGSAVAGLQNHDQQRVKIISSNKIRQSPSPPPNQVLMNLIQSPQVQNVHTSIKQQLQHKIQQSSLQQQQQQQPQLASDFIKGMINQSRSNNASGLQQKKTLSSGMQNCITLKKNNLNQNSPGSQQSFIKEMKKLGISKDIQEVNQMQQLLSENSPIRTEDKQQSQNTQKSPQNQPLITKISHIRNYSPPPNLNQLGPQPIVVKDLAHEPKISQVKIQETSQNDISNIDQNDSQLQHQDSQKFQFPFQRRARSLSLPKQEIIQNKMNQKTTGQQDDKDKTSQSPKRGLENQDTKRNKPVVANVNFVIAQIGIFGKGEDDSIFEKNKEVEEWLMGSGESDATAGSNTSNVLQGIPLNNRPSIKQKEPMKPTQPQSSNINDDSSSLEDEEEDWMFQTFDKLKAKKNNQQANTTRDQQKMPGRSRINQINDFVDDFIDESPFDMAPEMQQQFSKIKNEDQSFFLLDKIASNCNDLSQFIEQADEFMMQIQ